MKKRSEVLYSHKTNILCTCNIVAKEQICQLKMNIINNILKQAVSKLLLKPAGSGVTGGPFIALHCIDGLC